MPLNQDISNNAFSTQYQNKIFFYFALVFTVLLAVLKLPMAGIYYDTVSTLITFAPMIVILTMAGISFWKGRQYPDYQMVIRKFYLLFTLKFLAAILVFYIFYSPFIFSSPLLAFFHYLESILTLEGLYFFSSYILTAVIALAVVFVSVRAYQKTKGSYSGSIQSLIKKTLYAIFIFSFLVFVSSASAYPAAYKPLTDTLGDAIYTLSSGTLKFFKGGNAEDYAKINSLQNFAAKLSKSLAQTSQNLTENNQTFETNLTLASAELKTSITQSSKDLSDKIKEDLTGKLEITGGTLDGSLLIKGDNSDLTVEGTTTTRDIIPDDTLSYNLGKSSKSWNELYIHRLIGSSPVFVGTGSSSQGLNGDGDLVVSNNLEVKGTLYAGNFSVNSAYIFPNADGSANQVLQTDGNGNLSWEAGLAPGGSTGQLQFNNGTTFGADTNLFWNNSSKRLGIGTASPATELEVSGTIKATAFMLPGGIYLNADSVSTNYWAENGGDIYRETGNIGIGNNSPLERLDVTGRIRIAQGSAPGTTTDRLYNVAGDLFWNGLELGENFWTKYGTDNVSYNLSGNVGIGTTAPETKLDVIGTVKASNFYDNTNGVYLVPGSVNGNYWGESSGNIFRETGNVGIGTVNPAFKVHVASAGASVFELQTTDTTTSSRAGFQVGADMVNYVGGTQLWSLSHSSARTAQRFGITLGGWNEINASSGNGLIVGTQTNSPVVFGTTNLRRMIIDGSGNVGIGTTSPVYALDVVGGIASTGGISSISGGAPPGTGIINSTIYRLGGSTALNYSAGNLRLGNSATWTSASLYSDNAERLTIATGGNVGIGTLDPLYKLEVEHLNTANFGLFVSASLAANGTTGISFGSTDTPKSAILHERLNTYGRGDMHFAVNYVADGTTFVSKSDAKLTIQGSSGNVGIGTTSPAAKFEIKDNGTAALYLLGVHADDTGPWLAGFFNDTYSTTVPNFQYFGANDGTFKMGTPAAKAMGLYTNGYTNVALHIDSAQNIGIGTITPASRIHGVTTLSAATGDEIAYQLNYTTNKATSGNDTGLLINHTDTASPGLSYLLQGQLNGADRFLVRNDGMIRAPYIAPLVGGSSFTMSQMSFTQTSGSVTPVAILPTYNQASGTAANTDLLINRTQTAVGSGTQLLIDAQVGGVSKFMVTSTGGLILASAINHSVGANQTVLVNTYNPTTAIANGRVGLANGTDTATSGQTVAVKIYPTYNQSSGTAANTDLLINRTQTAVGSGTQLLIDAQVGGVSKFNISNTGVGYFAGNVGIGTTAADTTLKIIGSLCVKSTDAACAGTTAGTIYATNTTVTGADYAEYFETTDADLVSGEAVCLDPSKENAVKRCVRSADNNVMGIISSNPSIVGNSADNRDRDKNYKIVAMLGQIQGNVSTENGEIQIGDSLTSASIPGYLRKANPEESTVGVALQNFAKEKGTIQILISRRNKSLTVEKVEEAVSQRIAEMNVEDQVNALIADAKAELDQVSEAKFANLEERLLNQNDLIKMLEAQMAELKAKIITDSQLAFLASQVNLNTESITTLELLLGTKRVANPEDVDILGKLSAKNLATGGIEIVIIDPEAKTIGTATIVPADVDNDGKSVMVKTKAVTKDSKIFVNFGDNPGAFSWTEKLEKADSQGYSGFKILLSESVSKEVRVDWWIVEQK